MNTVNELEQTIDDMVNDHRGILAAEQGMPQPALHAWQGEKCAGRASRVAQTHPTQQPCTPGKMKMIEQTQVFHAT